MESALRLKVYYGRSALQNASSTLRNQLKGGLKGSHSNQLTANIDEFLKLRYWHGLLTSGSLVRAQQADQNM
jgi:hypothetical protein